MKTPSVRDQLKTIKDEHQKILATLSAEHQKDIEKLQTHIKLQDEALVHYGTFYENVVGMMKGMAADYDALSPEEEAATMTTKEAMRTTMIMLRNFTGVQVVSQKELLQQEAEGFIERGPEGKWQLTPKGLARQFEMQKELEGESTTEPS